MASRAQTTDLPEKRPEQSDEEFEAEMRAGGLRKVIRWVPDLSQVAVVEGYRSKLRALAAHQRQHPEELIGLTADDLADWR